jgi:hypothetical protein
MPLTFTSYAEKERRKNNASERRTSSPAGSVAVSDMASLLDASMHKTPMAAFSLKVEFVSRVFEETGFVCEV